MVRSSVRVVLRTRPTEAFARESLQINADKSITIHASSKGGISDKGALQQYQFKFDSILHNASQEEVFETCAADVLKGAMQGYNGTIMCYGQTGAGKTYTMTGGRHNYKARGLIPRTISALFGQLRSSPGIASWKLSISYMEIYNESLFDLLELTTAPHELTIHEHAKAGRLEVQGLKKVAVETEGDALALFFEGEANRVIGEHQLNLESSRSHSIFGLTLEIEPAEGATDGSAGKRIVSKINLVDLAGSERVSKTKSEGMVLREAGHINKSLHILEQVVLAMCDRGRDHVPYRSSKLTHVLKDSLGGNCRTVLIANVWGEAGQLDETLSTCRFAARMANVQCDVIANVVQEGGARVRQLEREVQELREELAMHDAFAAARTQEQQQMQQQYMPFSEAQRGQLRGLVVEWLAKDEADGASSLAPLQLTSVRMMREILYMLKDVYRRAGLANAGSFADMSISRQSASATQSTAQHSDPKTAPSSSSISTATAQAAGSRATGEERDWGEYVGEVDGADQSGGVGVAPDDARPPSTTADNAAGHQRRPSGGGIMAARALSAGTHSAGSQGMQTAQARSAGTPSTSAPHAPPSHAAALAEYRAGPGAAMAQQLIDNHQKMRASKRRARELALNINGLKRDMDVLKERGDELRVMRHERLDDGHDAIEVEHEYEEVASSIRDLKASYREAYGELQAVRSEAEYTAGLVAACSQELAALFSIWYEATYGVAQDAQASQGLLADLVSGPPGGRSGHTSVSSSAPATPPTRQRHNGLMQRGAGPGVLAGALTAGVAMAEDGEEGAEAAAYYAAQQGHHRHLGVSNAKKHHAQKGTFSTTERPDIAAKSGSLRNVHA